jgi:transcriptional regulator with XRE-family HTH domain
VKRAMVKKAPNPVDKHVGGRVRMRRMMLDMSQEKLGDALGLTFQQVQKYEKGANRVSASRLQHISDILRVPVPFFFEGAPHVPGQIKSKGAAPSPAYVTVSRIERWARTHKGVHADQGTRVTAAHRPPCRGNCGRFAVSPAQFNPGSFVHSPDSHDRVHRGIRKRIEL